MKKLFLLFLLAGCNIYAYAQQSDELNKLITDMVETLVDQESADLDYEDVVNDLINLSYNPINLNTAEKETMEQLFFLTDFQIENFLFYRYQNGPLYSIYELQAVEDMDSTTIRYMLPFVTVKPFEEKSKMRVYGQWLGRIQTTLHTPDGYEPRNDVFLPAYAGTKERWLSKGRVYLGNKAEVGFTLEKDPGEVAFPNNMPIADFSSGFVRLNKPVKFIERVIVGDYRLSFGQGAGLWTDMAFSKSTQTSQLRRRPKGINSYTSANESSYLRGGAVMFRWKNISLSPFVSYKKRDANLSVDSIGNISISSLQETGYHRTSWEIANRHIVGEAVWGAQMEYKHHLFHIETGYVNWMLDYPVMAKEHLRYLYRFSGSSQETQWLAYSVFLNKMTIFGEIAVQNQMETGLFNGVTFKPIDDVVASFAYRRYSNGYSAIVSNPFSESSIPGGESGVFASVQFKPSYKLELKAFADLFSYEWLRYQLYRPSAGFEWFAQANYRIDYNNSVYIRYKSSQKEINSGQQSNTYQLNNYQKDNIRVFYTYKHDDNWRFQTQVEHSVYKEDKRNFGWLAFQDIQYKSGKALNISLRYAVFDIDDYDSRIYSYEPDVLYAFSVPAYMYKGTRVLFNINFLLFKDCRVWARLAHTSYRNRDNISSGYQRIDGNKITEFKVQVQYRF